jgi:hypothetical protein
MGISRVAAAALCAAFFAGGAVSALAQEAPYGAPAQSEQQGWHGSHSRFLTPEQRIMWRMQHRDETKSMSPEQRESYRQQLRQQFLSMTPAQKAQMRDQLQAQWNQLSPDRQQKIEQRLAQRQQQGYGQRGERNSAGYPNGPSGQNGYPARGDNGQE